MQQKSAHLSLPTAMRQGEFSQPMTSGPKKAAVMFTLCTWVWSLGDVVNSRAENRWGLNLACIDFGLGKIGGPSLWSFVHTVRFWVTRQALPTLPASAGCEMEASPPAHLEDLPDCYAHHASSDSPIAGDQNPFNPEFGGNRLRWVLVLISLLVGHAQSLLLASSTLLGAPSMPLAGNHSIAPSGLKSLQHCSAGSNPMGYMDELWCHHLGRLSTHCGRGATTSCTVQ